MKKTNKTPQFTVRRQTELRSRQFGVYLNGKLWEGGYFSQAAAESQAAIQQTLADKHPELYATI